MYYLINVGGEISIKEVVTTKPDETYSFLKYQGFDLKGQFGRLDYAEIWKDFYNKKITRKELTEKLN